MEIHHYSYHIKNKYMARTDWWWYPAVLWLQWDNKGPAPLKPSPHLGAIRSQPGTRPGGVWSGPGASLSFLVPACSTSRGDCYMLRQSRGKPLKFPWPWPMARGLGRATPQQKWHPRRNYNLYWLPKRVNPKCLARIVSFLWKHLCRNQNHCISNSYIT